MTAQIVSSVLRFGVVGVLLRHGQCHLHLERRRVGAPAARHCSIGASGSTELFVFTSSTQKHDIFAAFVS